MQFPSFMEVAQSPRLTAVGIKVVVSATSFKSHEPVPLYGAYMADGKLLIKCKGEVDPWILITAIGQDIPGVWSRPVREKPNLAPVPVGPRPIPGPSVRETGFFNLDLRAHLRLPDEPGRYWIIVSLGDYITDRLSFEIK